MPESEINLKVRLGTEVLYNTKMCIDLKQPVINLKNSMCRLDDTLVITRLTIIFCGCVMEDHSPLYMYDVFEGCTLHVFKEIKPEKRVGAKALSETDLKKLGDTFNSFSMNSSYRAAMVKLNKEEVLNNIILTTLGLNEDPVAITLLQHSELLMRPGEINTDAVKRIAENHPALVSAALKIATAVQEELLKNNFTADMIRSMTNNISDEDFEDIDDLSPASETSSQPVSRNLSFTAITAAQLASAIASATTQQPQPSTSGASTSTASTGNINTVEQEEQTEDFDGDMQTMRDMGLSNDVHNLEALQLSGDLGDAVNLILNGLLSDIDNDNE